MVGGFPEQRGHQDKDLAFDDQGNLYVTIGLPSNACAQPDRQPGAKGVDPVPATRQRRRRVEVHADTPGQTYAAKNRYATGLRQGLALAWHDGHLYLAMNSRDSLDMLYPGHVHARRQPEPAARAAAESSEGRLFGWPYCFLDGKVNKMILAPEYGGNGTEIGRCAQFEAPIAGFPAHSAPVDLQFFSAPTCRRNIAAAPSS